MSEKTPVKNLKSTLLIIFIYLIVIGFVCAVLIARINLEIEESVISDMSARAEQAAKAMDDRFSHELQQLSEAASAFQSEEESAKYIEYLNRDENDGISYGILKINGEAVVGETLDFSEHPSLLDTFRGNPEVSYSSDESILFTVPVFNGQNVKYVLYKYYDCGMLSEKFSENFELRGASMMVADISGNTVLHLEGWEKDKDFFTIPEAEEAINAVTKLINTSASASARLAGKYSDSCLFAAELGYSDFYLVGIGSYEEVSGGIFMVRTLVIWTFGLLSLLIIIITIYLFGAEQKAKESDELREAKTIAENASRAKSDFLANMSHEIRTPINAVIGMNEMIIRESDSETVLGYAENIKKASRSLLSIINDILDFSKIESGKMEITEQSYSLSEILRNAVNMVKIRAEKKNLDFSVSVDERLPDRLTGDDVRVSQIIINLLNNAVKYTVEGSVSVSVEGDRMSEDTLMLRVIVRDTGIGIKKEDMDNLFAGFQRLDIKKNRNIEGTGLGLAITQRLAMLMNGEITVSSVYGEGSVFTAVIPQKISGKEAVGKFSEVQEKSASETGKYTARFEAPEAEILIVDDNAMNLMVARNLLKKTKVRITECMSGEETLNIIKRKCFDVILLDHMMPGMDGIETLRQSRLMEDNKCSGVPVIALTANAVSGVREMYLEAGFDDYLSKPIDGALFEAMLEKYIPDEKLTITGNKASEEKAEEPIVQPVHEEEAPVQLIEHSLGLRYCGDSEEMYREIMEIYCEMYEETTEKLNKFLAAEDWKNYVVSIHGLKSNSLNIGAAELSKKCLTLEKAGKAVISEDNAEENTGFIRNNHEPVMKLYTAVTEAARKYLGK